MIVIRNILLICLSKAFSSIDYSVNYILIKWSVHTKYMYVTLSHTARYWVGRMFVSCQHFSLYSLSQRTQLIEQITILNRKKHFFNFFVTFPATSHGGFSSLNVRDWCQSLKKVEICGSKKARKIKFLQFRFRTKGKKIL